jgi:AraC-like DNA-binding protein
MPTLLLRASLTNFVEVAREVGLDPYMQLRRAGIRASALLETEPRLPTKSVVRLLEESAQRSGVEDFGLRVGEHRPLSTMGPLAIVMRNERTLRKGLEALTRYLLVVNEAADLRLEEAGDIAVLTQGMIFDRRGSVRHSIECIVCVLYRMVKLVMGTGWKPRSICFTHSAPTSLATHRRVFAAPVRFDQDFDGIVLARSDLDAPMSSPDPVLAPHARELLDVELAQSLAPMPDKVRKLVIALLPTGRCAVERVAQHLGINRKTLYVQLARHGHTFSSIVDAVRVDLVARYVEGSDRPLSDVATLLGFSSPSAFSRWFSASFGSTVSARRRAKRQHRGRQRVV